jgi:flagellar biosynthesis protein FliQ
MIYMMSELMVLDLMKEVMTLIVLLATPVLAVTLVVGVVVGLIQAVTQIQEATLTFVPKIMAAFATITVMAPWMLSLFVTRTQQLFAKLPQYLQ